MARYILPIAALVILLSAAWSGIFAQELIPVKPTLLPDGIQSPKSLPIPLTEIPPELDQLLKQLKAAREGLHEQRDTAEKELSAAKESRLQEILKLRLRLAELMTKISTQSLKEKLSQPQTTPATIKKSEVPHEHPENVKPSAPSKTEATLPKILAPSVVDPLSLAHALFRLGRYEEALQSYQSLDLKGMRLEQSVPLRYMKAICLRKIGKLDEAKVLFREVANLKSDQTLAQAAQWQLATLNWHDDVHHQLAALQQRLKSLEKMP